MGSPSPHPPPGEVLPLSSSWGKGWAPVILILLGVSTLALILILEGEGPCPSGGMGSPHTCFLGRG